MLLEKIDDRSFSPWLRRCAARAAAVRDLVVFEPGAWLGTCASNGAAPEPLAPESVPALRLAA